MSTPLQPIDSKSPIPDFEEVNTDGATNPMLDFQDSLYEEAKGLSSEEAEHYAPEAKHLTPEAQAMVEGRNLTCVICFELLVESRAPLAVKCCGKFFCSSCLDKSTKVRGKQCAACNKVCLFDSTASSCSPHPNWRNRTFQSMAMRFWTPSSPDSPLSVVPATARPFCGDPGENTARRRAQSKWEHAPSARSHFCETKCWIMPVNVPVGGSHACSA